MGLTEEGALTGHIERYIPVEKRAQYMDALEEASVNQNIVPFAKLLAELIDA